MPVRDQNERGFTLIEVLVALVMTALLLAIIFDGVAAARTRVRTAEQQRSSLLLAQGLIADAAVAVYDPVPTSGTTDTTRWQVVQRIEARDPRGQLALISIEATVFRADAARQTTFTTRRIKALPQR